METFACKIELEGLPATVRSGQFIAIKAKVTETDVPVKTVSVSVPEGSIFRQMTKEPDGGFSLQMSVPYGGEGMTALVNITAIAEDGRRSATQRMQVKVGY